MIIYDFMWQIKTPKFNWIKSKIHLQMEKIQLNIELKLFNRAETEMRDFMTENTASVNPSQIFCPAVLLVFSLMNMQVCGQFVPGDSSQHSSVGVTERVMRQQQGGHASCGQSSPPVTRLNQQVHVAAQKTLLHVDVFTAVRQQEGLSVSWKRNTWDQNWYYRAYYSGWFDRLSGSYRCQEQLTKLIDKGGWVVPDATVESCWMLSQLVENLLHLKCC